MSLDAPPTNATEAVAWLRDQAPPSWSGKFRAVWLDACDLIDRELDTARRDARTER